MSVSEGNCLRSIVFVESPREDELVEGGDYAGHQQGVPLTVMAFGEDAVLNLG